MKPLRSVGTRSLRSASHKSVRDNPASDKPARWFGVLVAVVSVVGLVLRLWNIDFDQRQHLHPDERFWAITADHLAREPGRAPHGTIAGPLLDLLDGQGTSSPYRVTDNFLYGPVSLSLARSVGGWLHDGVVSGGEPAHSVARAIDAFGVPLIDDASKPRFDDRYQVDLIGRFLGAVLDTLTIVVIGFVGRRLGGSLAGVLAAGLYAVCVLAIQHAHFLGSEPLVGLGCALTVLATLRLDRSASRRAAWRTGLTVGAAAGLAVAAKLTAIGLIAVPAIGAALLVWRRRRLSDVVRLAGMAVGLIVAFRVLQPSAFNGLGMSLSADFLDDVRRAAELRNDASPPSFQWVGRTPVVQPLLWLGRFTLGPGTVIGAGLGIAAMVLGRWGRQWERTRRLGGLVASVETWTMFVIMASFVVPFVYVVRSAFPSGRYFYPMLPAVCATAGFGLATAFGVARRSVGANRRCCFVVATGALALSVVWGFAFVHGVYGHPNTRVAASRWVADQVPAGSVLTSEAWDDGLPLSLPGIDTAAYRSEQLHLVEPDSVDKTLKLADQLTRVDYVVESSPRIWGVVGRMPARFPSTIAFFAALDSGRAGFQRVATFRSGLRLGPWRLGERAAEEAFSVYDHPEVRIWKKVRTVERTELLMALDLDGAASAIAVDPTRGAANGLMLTPDERVRNETGLTYNEAFSADGTGAFHALGILALVELFGFAAFVLILPVTRRLPDAGLGVSKVFGLLTMAFVTFVCVVWFGRTLDRSLISIVAVGLVSLAVWRARKHRSELKRLWRERRDLLVIVEMLTVVTFAAFVMLRSLNPDLWHPSRSGEKPFELAYLTAVLRTRTLPVYDPWFSGGAMNYYYGGWYLLAAPARLLRTAPGLVLNLGLGVFASCTAGAAFTTGAALAGGLRTCWRQRSRSSRLAGVAGVLASGFAVTASNAAILAPLWRKLTGSTRAGSLDWWALSRVIPESVAITEFPAWSLLFSDLHPHVMDLPLLLALGALAWLWHDAVMESRRREGIGLAVMLAIVVGFVRMTNTWDVPLAVGVCGLAMVLVWWRTSAWRRLVEPVVAFAAVLVGAFWPYVSRGEVFDAGFDPAGLRTPLTSWSRQFGVFAVITAVVVIGAMFVVLRRGHHRRFTATISAAIVLAEVLYRLARPEFAVFQVTASLAAGCGWLAWWRSKHGHADGRALAAVGPLVLGVGWAIQAAVELFTVRHDSGRMNTVFKFWYQSWLVLSVGAAVVAAGELVRRGGLRRTMTAVVAFALGMSVVFWWWATPVRLDDRLSQAGLSLAGEAVLTRELTMEVDGKRFVPADDVQLADWLRANVPGIRPIAEAPGVDYRWTSRMSWMTGLPSPIGWPYHQSQQRRPYQASIDRRVKDLRNLYTTTDEVEMARVLATYRIEYLVFGTQEHLLATDASAAALRGFECLRLAAVADRTADGDGGDGQFYVATVDRSCLSRHRPA